MPAPPIRAGIRTEPRPRGRGSSYSDLRKLVAQRPFKNRGGSVRPFPPFPLPGGRHRTSIHPSNKKHQGGSRSTPADIRPVRGASPFDQRHLAALGVAS